MLVISDTTPIISLLKIDKLDLLRDLFKEVAIPQAVFLELTSNEGFAEEAEVVASCEFLSVEAVENREAVSVLQRSTGLHLGESEALVLADLLHADLVLLDEVAGRSVASRMNLEHMGTIGILATACKKGLLTAREIESCINTLKENGRHISDALYKKLIDMVSNDEVREDR